MDPRILSGLLLIVGPIVTITFSFLIFPEDPSNINSTLKELSINPALIGTAAIMSSFGFILSVCGFYIIKDKMRGGLGENYANISMLFLIISIPAKLVELGLISVAADTSAISFNTADKTAEILWIASQGVGTISTIIFSIGIFTFGIGILFQKNYTFIIPFLLIITGISGVLVPATIGYDSSNMLIIYILYSITAIITGIFTIFNSKYQ